MIDNEAHTTKQHHYWFTYTGMGRWDPDMEQYWKLRENVCRNVQSLHNVREKLVEICTPRKEMYKYWQMKESTEAHVCSGKWGGGGQMNKNKKSIETEQYARIYRKKKLTCLHRKCKDRIEAVCSGKGGGVNNQRLKVKPINISPQNPRMKNITYFWTKRCWGRGGGHASSPPPPPPTTHKTTCKIIWKKRILYKNV